MANSKTSLNGYEYGRNPKTTAPFWAGSGDGAEIDDDVITTDKTWSSVKIHNELIKKADKTELASYAKVTSVYTKSESYSKAEVDELINEIPAVDAYTKAQTDSLLADKANASDVYTKTQTDKLLDDKADVTDLANYAKVTSVYTKAQTYTKAEVDDLIEGATPAPVDAYTKSETDNLLSGYAKVTSVYTKTQTYTKAEVDELIEATTPAPVDAYTKAQTDSLLESKADAASVYTKTQTDNLLADKANVSDVYTKTQTDNLLADKANVSDMYTKTQTDNLVANKADKANSMRYDTTNSKAQYYNNGVWTNVPEAGSSEPLAQRLLGVFSNYDIYTGYLLDAKLGITIGPATVATAITDGLPFSHILDYDSPYKLSGLGDNDLKIVPIGTKYDSTTYQNVNVNLYVYKTGTYSTSGSGVVDYVAQLNKILNKVVNGDPDGTEEFFKAEQESLYGVNFYNGHSWISRSFTQKDSGGVQYTEDVDEFEMYTSAGTTYAQKVHAIGWKSDLVGSKCYVKRGSSTEWVDVNVSDVKTRYNETNYDIAVNLVRNLYNIKAKHYPNYLTWNYNLSEMLEWYN